MDLSNNKHLDMQLEGQLNSMGPSNNKEDMKPEQQLISVEPSTTKDVHINLEEQHWTMDLSPNKNVNINSEELEDIYEDVINYDMGEEVEVVKSQNVQLLEHINSLDQDIEKLTKVVTTLSQLQRNLSRNISSLYTTARAEIERKDRIIADLRRELDDLTFRRQTKRKENEEFGSLQHKRMKYSEDILKDNEESNLNPRNYLSNKEHDSHSMDRKTEHENVSRRENNKYARDYSSTRERDRKTKHSEDNSNENREASRYSRDPMNRERGLSYNDRRRIGCKEDATKENKERNKYSKDRVTNRECDLHYSDRKTERNEDNIKENRETSRSLRQPRDRRTGCNEDSIKGNKETNRENDLYYRGRRVTRNNSRDYHINKEHDVLKDGSIDHEKPKDKRAEYDRTDKSNAYGTRSERDRRIDRREQNILFNERAQEDSGNASAQDHSDNTNTTVEVNKIECTAEVTKVECIAKVEKSMEDTAEIKKVECSAELKKVECSTDPKMVECSAEVKTVESTTEIKKLECADVNAKNRLMNYTIPKKKLKIVGQVERDYERKRSSMMESYNDCTNNGRDKDISNSKRPTTRANSKTEQKNITVLDSGTNKGKRANEREYTAKQPKKKISLDNKPSKTFFEVGKELDLSKKNHGSNENRESTLENLCIKSDNQIKEINQEICDEESRDSLEEGEIDSDHESDNSSNKIYYKSQDTRFQNKNKNFRDIHDRNYSRTQNNSSKSNQHIINERNIGESVSNKFERRLKRNRSKSCYEKPNNEIDKMNKFTSGDHKNKENVNGDKFEENNKQKQHYVTKRKRSKSVVIEKAKDDSKRADTVKADDKSANQSKGKKDEQIKSNIDDKIRVKRSRSKSCYAGNSDNVKEDIEKEQGENKRTNAVNTDDKLVKQSKSEKDKEIKSNIDDKNTVKRSRSKSCYEDNGDVKGNIEKGEDGRKRTDAVNTDDKLTKQSKTEIDKEIESNIDHRTRVKRGRSKSCYEDNNDDVKDTIEKAKDKNKKTDTVNTDDKSEKVKYIESNIGKTRVQTSRSRSCYEDSDNVKEGIEKVRDERSDAVNTDDKLTKQSKTEIDKEVESNIDHRTRVKRGRSKSCYEDNNDDVKDTIEKAKDKNKKTDAVNTDDKSEKVKDIESNIGKTRVQTSRSRSCYEGSDDVKEGIEKVRDERSDAVNTDDKFIKQSKTEIDKEMKLNIDHKTTVKRSSSKLCYEGNNDDVREDIEKAKDENKRTDAVNADDKLVKLSKSDIEIEYNIDDKTRDKRSRSQSCYEGHNDDVKEDIEKTKDESNRTDAVNTDDKLIKQSKAEINKEIQPNIDDKTVVKRSRSKLCYEGNNDNVKVDIERSKDESKKNGTVNTDDKLEKQSKAKKDEEIESNIGEKNRVKGNSSKLCYEGNSGEVKEDIEKAKDESKRTDAVNVDDKLVKQLKSEKDSKIKPNIDDKNRVKSSRSKSCYEGNNDEVKEDIEKAKDESERTDAVNIDDKFVKRSKSEKGKEVKSKIGDKNKVKRTRSKSCYEGNNDEVNEDIEKAKDESKRTDMININDKSVKQSKAEKEKDIKSNIDEKNIVKRSKSKTSNVEVKEDVLKTTHNSEKDKQEIVKMDNSKLKRKRNQSVLTDTKNERPMENKKTTSDNTKIIREKVPPTKSTEELSSIETIRHILHEEFSTHDGNLKNTTEEISEPKIMLHDGLKHSLEQTLENCEITDKNQDKSIITFPRDSPNKKIVVISDVQITKCRTKIKNDDFNSSTIEKDNSNKKTMELNAGNNEVKNGATGLVIVSEKQDLVRAVSSQIHETCSSPLNKNMDADNNIPKTRIDERINESNKHEADDDSISELDISNEDLASKNGGKPVRRSTRTRKEIQRLDISGSNTNSQRKSKDSSSDRGELLSSEGRKNKSNELQKIDDKTALKTESIPDEKRIDEVEKVVEAINNEIKDVAVDQKSVTQSSVSIPLCFNTAQGEIGSRTPNNNTVETRERRRITPIPVKDNKPVCTFANILEKNSSSTFTVQSTLHLTHDGEIPLLHIEENHLNNLAVDEGMKTSDNTIMKLLDTMNISNMDCELTKFKSSGESIGENQSVSVPNQLTFENFMDKVTSTPIKPNQTNVSDKSKNTVSVQNRNIRRRRAVSKIFFMDD